MRISANQDEGVTHVRASAFAESGSLLCATCDNPLMVWEYESEMLYNM